MLRCKMSVALVVVCAAALILPAVAQATFLQVSADTKVLPRADLVAENHGTDWNLDIGGEGSWTGADRSYAMFQWDLSSAPVAPTGTDVRVTINLSGDSEKAPRNFVDQTIDLYQMSTANTAWEEGNGPTAGHTGETGAAWNRMKGLYSTTPPDTDKWIPTSTNRVDDSMTKLDTITWTQSMNDNRDPLVYTVSASAYNAWQTAGMVSFYVRSDSVDTLLQGGDSTQRLMFLASRDQTGLGAFIDVVPEPTSLTLLGLGCISLLAYAWRKRK